MRETIDHYRMLNLPRDAGDEAVHQAYRTLARIHHPDVNPGPDAARLMTLVNEAYACLSDPDKRRRYDETLGVREPPALRDAVLDAAVDGLAQTGWKRAEIRRGDWIFEGHGLRVLVRFVPVLGSSDLEHWLRAARGAFRQNSVGSAVAVAYRVRVAEVVPRRVPGVRIPATAIDLIAGSIIGSEFEGPAVEELFKPLLAGLD